MENLFIKNIINQQFFDNSPSLVIDGIFDYNPEKIDLISFTKIQEEFEIIDKDIDEELKNKKDEILIVDEDKPLDNREVNVHVEDKNSSKTDSNGSSNEDNQKNIS